MVGIGRYLILCSLCAGLAACEGDAKFDSGAVGFTAPGGYYTGRLTRDGSTTEFPVKVVVGENGRMLWFSDAAALAYFGRLESQGEEFSGSFRAFNMLGSRGQSIDTGQLSGVAEQRRSLDGRFTEAAGPDGAFSLDYDTAGYESIFPLTTLAGDWIGPGDYHITISERGELSGGSDFGCSYTGRLTIINPAYSPYNLRLTETCGATVRSMTGLAVPEFNLFSGETVLVLAAADAEEARLIGLRR